MHSHFKPRPGHDGLPRTIDLWNSFHRRSPEGLKALARYAFHYKQRECAKLEEKVLSIQKKTGSATLASQQIPLIKDILDTHRMLKGYSSLLNALNRLFELGGCPPQERKVHSLTVIDKAGYETLRRMNSFLSGLPPSARRGTYLNLVEKLRESREPQEFVDFLNDEIAMSSRVSIASSIVRHAARKEEEKKAKAAKLWEEAEAEFAKLTAPINEPAAKAEVRAGLREKAQADAADKLRRSQEESGYTRFSRSAYAQFGIKRGEVMDSILKAAEPGDMHSGEFLKSVHGEMRRRMNAVAAFLEILENRSIKLVPQEEEIALYHLFFIVAAANMHPANAENTPRVRGGIIAQADGYFSDSKERGAAMLALGLPRNFIAYIGGACALHFGNLAKNSK